MSSHPEDLSCNGGRFLLAPLLPTSAALFLSPRLSASVKI